MNEFKHGSPSLAAAVADLALELDLASLAGDEQSQSLTAGHGMTEASASFCCAPPPNCCNCSCS
ncbi:thiomuracin/GE37468 family thiazolyl RiPP peptide [Kitasatospora sp. NPDC008050]|uniref:thiomuracin/GE37468 family thiazolyl RiPP peptide n=1 Tax=Kitasatospora sp. NPDC008050 TaxID=3364021 RepID=UPI0036EDF635